MAKRPVTGSKKKRTKLHRVDAARALALAEFEKVKAWAERTLAAAAGADVSAPPVSMRTVRIAAMVLVLLGTAARRFELCGFRCGDFRESFGAYRCYFEAGKGNVEAEITISDETWDVVQKWCSVKRAIGEGVGADDPLFCGRPGEHLGVAQLHNIWVAIRGQLGVARHKNAHISVHMTRHTAGLLLLRSTKSLAQVSDFMRHGSIEVTEKFYKHVLAEDVAAGLTKAGL